MTAQVHSFRFTPAGKPARDQQVHEAEFSFRRDPDDRQRLWIWIDSTRPGETSDDRGVEGWDSGVIVAVMTAPLALPDRGAQLDLPNALPDDEWGERFLYYWEHSDFVAASLTLSGAKGVWQLSFTGTSGEGDAVAFEASFTG